MNYLLEAALNYRSSGLSVIAVNQSKKAIWRWKRFQHRLPTINEINKMFANQNAFGIAIICGPISGNFEAIDFDLENDLTGSLYNDFVECILRTDPSLIGSLPKATTRSGGCHWYYRCAEVGKCQHLAQRLPTEQEWQIHPKQNVKVLIELRGTSGIVIVPPTPDYTFLQHDLMNIPVITGTQREKLIRTAKQFHQIKQKPDPAPTTATTHSFLSSESPFNDFNKRGDIIGLLERHGWEVVERKNGRTYFRRPGDTDHDTSGDFHHGLGLFGVFTSNSDFTPYKGYKPYAVYAILECGGDFNLAVKQLLAEGYGKPYKNRF